MLKNWRFWFAVKRPQNEVLSIKEEEPETNYTIPAQMFQSAHTPQPFGRCSEWQ